MEGPKRKILVALSQKLEVTHQAYIKSLRGAQFDVVSPAEADELVALAREGPALLVIGSVTKLAGVTGLDLIERLTALSPPLAAPILVLQEPGKAPVKFPTSPLNLMQRWSQAREALGLAQPKSLTKPEPKIAHKPVKIASTDKTLDMAIGSSKHGRQPPVPPKPAPPGASGGEAPSPPAAEPIELTEADRVGGDQTEEIVPGAVQPAPQAGPAAAAAPRPDKAEAARAPAPAPGDGGTSGREAERAPSAEVAPPAEHQDAAPPLLAGAASAPAAAVAAIAALQPQVAPGPDRTEEMPSPPGFEARDGAHPAATPAPAAAPPPPATLAPLPERAAPRRASGRSRSFLLVFIAAAVMVIAIIAAVVVVILHDRADQPRRDPTPVVPVVDPPDAQPEAPPPPTPDAGAAEAAGDAAASPAKVPPNTEELVLPIRFRRNEVEPSSVTKREMRRIIDLIRDNPTAELELTGHASSDEAPAQAESLGTRRAKAARDLICLGGPSRKRFTVTSAGASQPLRDAGNQELVNDSRRVVLRITKRD